MHCFSIAFTMKAQSISLKEKDKNNYTLIEYLDNKNSVDTSFDLYLLVGQSKKKINGFLKALII